MRGVQLRLKIMNLISYLVTFISFFFFFLSFLDSYRWWGSLGSAGLLQPKNPHLPLIGVPLTWSDTWWWLYVIKFWFLLRCLNLPHTADSRPTSGCRGWQRFRLWPKHTACALHQGWVVQHLRPATPRQVQASPKKFSIISSLMSWSFTNNTTTEWRGYWMFCFEPVVFCAKVVAWPGT